MKDYVSKLNLYGKITEKHAEEINEMINQLVDEAKKEIQVSNPLEEEKYETKTV